MTAMFEALSFLGPRGPVTHDEQSRIYYDSMHAAGILSGTRSRLRTACAACTCMSTILRYMRSTVGYGSPCNMCLVTVGIWGNECADHAAAFDTFGLVSGHNVVTRWICHNFDASVCFDGCNNISDILERLHHIRTNATTSHQDRV